MELSKLYKDFTSSERSAGMVLLACAVISLVLANVFGDSYLSFWHVEFIHKPLELWINDGLMTVFFLMVGLEIEREVYIGELSDLKKSMLPALAALGGMLVPAIIHFAFNNGAVTQKGFGIPMATDIAFSLAVLSLLGNRVPVQLKVFLTALAIIDDLGAILVIALFYTKELSFSYLGLAVAIFAVMFLLNRMKVFVLWLYLLLGMLMWFCMYRSGIHATISGVLLAFAIPFGKGEESSISYKLQHRLHLPVAYIVLPLFALANMAIRIPQGALSELSSANSLGVIFGLFLGKPLGIFSFSMLGVMLGWCALPEGVKRQHLFWVGLLAGIGFTMSIFITLLAFDEPEVIDSSKIAVIVGSLVSALIGFAGLKHTYAAKSTKGRRS